MSSKARARAILCWTAFTRSAAWATLMALILPAVQAARAIMLALISWAPIAWAGWACWPTAGAVLACGAMSLS